MAGTDGTAIGLDLAAQPRETAACVIAWRGRTGSVDVLTAGLSDDGILELLRGRAPAKIAIDAPFGWPTPFVDAVAGYQQTGNGARATSHRFDSETRIER
jgi:Protein of unknown function (DUF429)